MKVFNEYITIWNKLKATNSSNEKIDILIKEEIDDGYIFKLMLGEYPTLDFSKKMLSKVKIDGNGNKKLKIEGVQKFLIKLEKLSGHLKIDFCNMFSAKIRKQEWEWLQKIILKRMELNISSGVILKYFAVRFNHNLEDIKTYYACNNNIEETFTFLRDGGNPKNLEIKVGEFISPMLSKKWDG